MKLPIMLRKAHESIVEDLKTSHAGEIIKTRRAVEIETMARLKSRWEQGLEFYGSRNDVNFDHLFGDEETERKAV